MSASLDALLCESLLRVFETNGDAASIQHLFLAVADCIDSSHIKLSDTVSRQLNKAHRDLESGHICSKDMFIATNILGSKELLHALHASAAISVVELFDEFQEKLHNNELLTIRLTREQWKQKFGNKDE